MKSYSKLQKRSGVFSNETHDYEIFVINLNVNGDDDSYWGDTVVLQYKRQRAHINKRGYHVSQGDWGTDVRNIYSGSNGANNRYRKLRARLMQMEIDIKNKEKK